MRHFALSLVIGLPASALAASPTFTVVDLGTLPGLEWAPLQPLVANSASEIGSLGAGITYIYQQTSDASVGESAVANPSCSPSGVEFHAFLFSGTLHDLGTLNSGCQSAALSVNASHVVVGWSQMDVGITNVDAFGGLQTAFVWGNGIMQALPSLLQAITTRTEAENNSSSANSINSVGEIVGETAQLLTTWEIAHLAALWENSGVAKPLELQFQLGSTSGTVIFTNASAVSCQGNIAVTGYPVNHSPTDVHSYLLVRQGARRSCPE
jgi:uncharacterized membrane protein